MAQPLLFPFAEYWWIYAGFVLFVLGMLGLDLGVFHRQAHRVSFREATLWVVACVCLALLFNVGLYYYTLSMLPSHPSFAGQSAAEIQEMAAHVSLEFLTGYIVEQSLAIDNIFVFVLVFSYFGVPAKDQHRVLHLGILGALVFRGIFIALGTLLLQYKFVVWVFGLFLVYTGIRMVFADNEHVDPERNVLMRLLRRVLPVTPRFHGSQFFAREGSRWFATPLFVALAFLELTDIVFAIDSVPAIFAITSEPLIVFTSNIFAIIGLRSMYFMLAGSVDKFHLLKYGLAGVLVFVGLKMVWLNELYHGEFPISYSLMIIAACIGGSIAASFLFPAPVKHLPDVSELPEEGHETSPPLEEEFK